MNRILKHPMYYAINLLVVLSSLAMMPTFAQVAFPFLARNVSFATTQNFFYAGAAICLILLVVFFDAKNYDLFIVVLSYFLLALSVGILTTLAAAGIVDRSSPSWILYIVLYNQLLREYLFVAVPIHLLILSFISPIKRFRERYILDSGYDGED